MTSSTRVIRERRASAGAGRARGDDLLSLLLHAQDIDGTRMTDRQLRDEAMTLFIAGHRDHRLALVVDVVPAVAASRRRSQALGRARRDPRRTPAQRGDLPVDLHGKRREWNRCASIRPPNGFGREALQDCEIGGYAVAQGHHALHESVANASQLPLLP